MYQPDAAMITDLQVQRTDDFGEAVLAGLASTPKRLYPRLLYDQRGSLLFEEITRQPEYYPTRVEAELLREKAGEVLEALDQEVDLIELGSGSSRKTRILLDLLVERQGQFEYRPIDISEEILRATAAELQVDYPDLVVHGYVADFLAGLDFLKHRRARPRLILFLGSNLGNFEYDEAAEFLGELRKATHDDDRVLLGLDMDKDPAAIEAAYDDAAGVTEEFILNLLDRVNREMGGDFDREKFRFDSAYNREEQKVEIRLVSRQDQEVVLVEVEESFHFEAGEPIEVEVSCKYTPERIDWILAEAGFRQVRQVTDRRGWFTLNLLQPA